MTRLTIMTFMLLGLSSSSAWAQCGCCDKGTPVTAMPNATAIVSDQTASPTPSQPATYRRFSYEPSYGPQAAPSGVVDPVSLNPIVPAVVTAQPQSVDVGARRFSYRHSPQPWELQKTDRRRDH